MPTPKPAVENREEWLERCVPEVVDEGADPDQALAICSSMWRDADMDSALAKAVQSLRSKYI